MSIKKFKTILKFYYLEFKRQKLIKELRKKKKIKVAFLGWALGGSSDVFSNLYNIFAKDKRFEPYAIIVPNSFGAKESMIELQNQAAEYLEKLNIPYIKGYNEEKDIYVDIEKIINPDIVCMCHNYEWFPREFRIDNFLGKITYIFQYSLLLVDNIKYHCTCKMHELGHKVFYYPEVLSQHIEKQYSYRKNICNDFLGELKLDFLTKIKNRKRISKNAVKKIIWAPHHYDGPFSNFIECSDLFLKIAEKYKNEIKIIFRPHPGLKNSLIRQGIWDESKANSYWNKWQEIGIVSTGDFIDIFEESDAMILDSISFLGEYAYINKPALFINKRNQKNQFNTFGQEIQDISYNCWDLKDIDLFIQKVVLNGEDILKAKRENYIQNNMLAPNNKTAAENVYDYIISDLHIN